MSDITLYSYFRSSCSARVRMSLDIKGIPYDYVPVNLLKGDQLSDEHRAVNPSASVPLLVPKPSGSPDQHEGVPFRIGQSLAALEYLEEAYPETTRLLPSDIRARAIVRALANIIAADTQPVTNLRIMRRVRELGGSAEDWNKSLMAEGLRAYEAVSAPYAGRFSYGDDVSLADLCLLPAAWNAQRFGVDLAEFPVVGRVVKNLEGEPAMQKASYFKQVDTPENLRA
ncbi:unnamed protein product [Clonostachys rosea f. rosea IK726]|uniref:Uncharacterized protein n=1 Tax=Clonostachys rosea f. rosea IK726 TaxID=1349383 RepID=A0ACA9URC7_BIOOC|nr:unnamed protein product [Clonostachys rosea f. rosea IK726]